MRVVVELKFYKHFSLVIIIGSFSSFFAQEETQYNDKAIKGLHCSRSVVVDELPETKIELLTFLAVDSIKVDYLPEIVGGADSLLTIIMYPEIARRAGVEGIVIIEFTIDSAGKVKNYEIINGIGAGCDDAVIGGLTFGPKFLPAKKDNKPIDILIRIAVKFSLSPGKVASDTPLLYQFDSDFFFPILEDVKIDSAGITY